MATVKKSVLMEYLQCTLCMEDMQRSCILQCHHSFCVDCLQKYIAQAIDPQKMTCPICRKVTTLPEGDLTNLPPNFFMDNLKELITKETDGDEDEMKVTACADREVVICSLEDCQGEAVMYCTLEKVYMCQTCTEEHAAGRFSKKHQSITAAEAKGMTPSTKIISSTKSHHPCGRHPNQMLDMYCKTCEEIICHECINTDHSDHHITSLRPFVKPCEERLDTLLKRIDKLLMCVDLARQTSQQQVDKAQHHIVSLKKQVNSTFTHIREKLAQQEERLMSDLERAAARVDKVASSTKDDQQLAEVNLESLHFLGDSLSKEGDVYDQVSNLPSLEEAVEKRWRTEIPGVVWMEQSDQDEKKINLSDVDHLTLTETSDTTTVLPRLDLDGRDMVTAFLERDTTTDQAQSGGAASFTNPASNKADQHASESGEIIRFLLENMVHGICMYNNNIFLVNYGAEVFIYSSNGDLVKKHVMQGIKGLCDVTLMTHDDGDKLIITGDKPHSLHYVLVQSAGDTCTLGTTHSKKISYDPWGLCVNHNNNLVVAEADWDNGRLHVYNSSGDEISTIKLPSGFNPVYLASDPSGGYIVTGGTSKQIILIDGEGAQLRHCKDTACGIALSNPRGVVRDSENRYLVADYGNNQLLLFIKDGSDVRCLVKDKITKPHTLYLDQQQDKLYVGTGDGQVVVYDYYMLVGKKHPIKYNMTRLSIKSTSPDDLHLCHSIDVGN